MPTYSYRCTKCDNTFDAFHSMSCTDPQHCPACAGVGKKLLSATSIIFKGSGFYTTDYRDSGYIEAKSKDSSSSTSSSSSSAGSSSSGGNGAKEASPATPAGPAAPAAAPTPPPAKTTESPTKTATPST